MSTEPPLPPASPAVPASHHHHGPTHTHCENCGTQLAGPYCHACGQHDFEFHRSFRHVFMEALENFFHFEGKFFRNIVVLLFWPGRLTQEFNQGKRAAQMPPFRLYLFVSVLFFFLFFLDQERTRSAVAFGGMDQSWIETVREAEASARREVASQAPAPGEAPSTARPAAPVIVESGDPEWLQRLADRWQSEEARARLGDTFVHSIPRLLLFCLPLFALYTRLLFRKSGQVYLQHLVLALHFHTFVYLWRMFRDGWEFLGGLAHPTVGTILFRLCMLWAVLYPVLMLRRLFQNSWRKTVFKAGVLAGAYGVTLGVSFAVAGALLVAFG